MWKTTCKTVAFVALEGPVLWGTCRLLSPSLYPGLPVRMSLSSSHPALTPIKSTLPPMEAPLSALSVFWSPSCPPWTSSSAACQSLQSPAAQVKPLPPDIWVCSRWIPVSDQSLSGLNHTAPPGPAKTGYVLYARCQQIPVVTWLITAATCYEYCDRRDFVTVSKSAYSRLTALLFISTCRVLGLSWYLPHQHLNCSCILSWAVD